MDEQKATFIKNDFFVLVRQLTPHTTALWGKMTAQQAIEHLADFFDVSTAKINFGLSVPEEALPKYREFLYSDKAFRENTKAPVNIIGEDPMPVRYPDLDEAKMQLKKSVDDFFTYFSNNPDTTTLHPVFGPLTYDEWTLLHFKHVTHHLRQFGILPALHQSS